MVESRPEKMFADRFIVVKKRAEYRLNEGVAKFNVFGQEAE